MAAWWNDILICPHCRASLEREGNSLICRGTRRHAFDIAKEGYVNLAPPRAAGGGDDSSLIAARTSFLTSGHYAAFADRIGALLSLHLKGPFVADAGCGEGYYGNLLAEKGFSVLGFDLSKRGIRHGAKIASRHAANAFFGVAGLYTLPLADASVDGVISLFAPIAEEEFLRVLKPGGILLAAGAGADHLLELKSLLYDTPRENQPRADLPQRMRMIAFETLKYDMELDHAAMQSLFAMTPYFYRTSKESHARLVETEHLTCRAAFDIHVFEKI